jgi:poly-gamma-glutamate synthesis protein (capsule biosynthesis protein)
MGMIGLVLSILLGCSSAEDQLLGGTAGCGRDAAAGEISIFLAGDSIIIKPWSEVDDPAFLQLVEEIRRADVAIANLETVIHDFKGFAQADSGGTYMSSPPEIAPELAWAGFDMVAHANNHTFDFGATGVLENLEHVEKAGLLLAGSGKDLQSARAPAYLESSAGTVALVSTASTFVSYGRASLSRPELPGRPGLNPLRVSWNRNLEFMRPITITIPARPTVNPQDLEGNLEAVQAARRRADVVVFSIHAHERNGRWLQALAHQVIDAGADVFFAHGPHAVQGVEIYHCRPIFYGLGDFVFQQEQIRRLPPEYYEEQGLKGDAKWEELQALREDERSSGTSGRRATHEGVGALVRIGASGASEIRLLPVDLSYGEPIPVRGRPKIADSQLGREIIADVSERSKSLGTTIQYLESENVGVVSFR